MEGNRYLGISERKVRKKETSSPSPDVPSHARELRDSVERRKERAAGMIAQGKKQSEIARKLGVSTRAVKRYRADPQVKEMVEESRKRMMESANITAKEVIGTLATQMRGSLLDLLTPSGGFSVEHARKSGFECLLKSVTVRQEVSKKGEVADVVRIEIHSQQRAAVELARILKLKKEVKDPNDREMLKKLLDERIAFAIEGFRRGGIQLTRRDVLEMYKDAPESQRELMPLILKELDGE